MIFHPTAFALLLHVYFGGAGLAWLIAPRAWKRCWPLFAGVAGVALQYSPVAIRSRARALVDCELEVSVNGKRRRRAKIGTDLAWVKIPSITVAPGTTIVKMKSSPPPQPANATDHRLLGFAAYRIDLDVKPDPDPVDN